MVKILIRYLIHIKSPKKIYHYLKYIYFNKDYFKTFFRNDEFKNYIYSNEERPINNNCKYCQYIQILCILIRSELSINKECDIFKSLPKNFIKSPNFMLIKHIFINYFNIDHKKKFKFIKSSKALENEMDLLKTSNQGKNYNFYSIWPMKNS